MFGISAQYMRLLTSGDTLFEVYPILNMWEGDDIVMLNVAEM